MPRQPPIRHDFSRLCRLRGACRSLDFALHAVHEVLNRLDLLRQRLGAGALAFQRFFVFALLALAFVDQAGNAALVLRERRAVFYKRISALAGHIPPHPRKFRKVSVGDSSLPRRAIPNHVAKVAQCTAFAAFLSKHRAGAGRRPSRSSAPRTCERTASRPASDFLQTTSRWSSGARRFSASPSLLSAARTRAAVSRRLARISCGRCCSFRP